MLSKRETFIRDNLGAFSPGLLQDLKTLIYHLRSIGVEEYEFLEYVEAEVLNGKHVRSNATIAKQQRNAPKCPECGSPLAINAVNTTKCNNVGGEWKSQISCTSFLACDYEEFRTDEPIDVYGEFMDRSMLRNGKDK